MYSPQIENGHLDIANELVERFAKTYLSANEWRVLWVVLRKTWAWHKKEDRISLTQFQKISELSRPSVRKAITKLVAKGILVAVGDTFIHTYRVNKLYSTWTSSGRATSSYRGHNLVAVGGTKLVAVGSPTKEKKETNTKETITMEQFLSNSENIEKLKEKFPSVNVDIEVEKIIDWRKNNHKRIIDYMAFCRNWLRNAKPSNSKEVIVL